MFIMLEAFDPHFYLASNPDVQLAGVDPLDHYLHFGWQELRDPNEVFCERTYRRRFELVSSDGPSLLHFEHNYENLALSPHVLIDREFLAIQAPNANLDVRSRDALLALPSDLSIHPVFDTAWMLHTYPDLGGAGINPCVHYLFWGERELRDPRGEVSASALRDQLDALGATRAQLTNPVTTWLTYGSVLALRPNPLVDPESVVVRSLTDPDRVPRVSDAWDGSAPLIDWELVQSTSRPSLRSSGNSASLMDGTDEALVSPHPTIPRQLILELVDHYHRG